ncbi:MAG: GGDEF domain-containing protein [Alphaproteobacteria bacterium]|nr:GGDEF domain-containing protein [Alphaproteobacteria bacterium]
MSDTLDFAKSIARKAVPEMIQRQVPPTPQNFSVWYTHCTGRNRALTQKMNKLIKADTQFTPTLNAQLYDTYISNKAERTQIQRQSFTAQSLMTDLLDLMGVMNSETNTYNQKLDGYIDDLSGKYEDSGLQNMMKALVNQTKEMRDSGGELNQKLADSRKEVEHLRENLEKITEEASRDALTGLANRKAFDAKIKEFIEQAKEGEIFSLLMLDIDHFKKFNDAHGHLVGDEVLKIVAKELMNAVKGRDVVARFGGEEFAVLLPTTSLQGALVVAENLRHSIASRELARKDSKINYGSITISIGAGQFLAGQDTPASLIKRADEALYRSKKGGRNRVTQESFD